MSDQQPCPKCKSKNISHKYANCLCHVTDAGGNTPTCWSYPVCDDCGFTNGPASANSDGGSTWETFV